MLASQLQLPLAVKAPETLSQGDRLLIGGGLAVALGPGLVAGGPLLQRVFARLEGALTEALSADGAHAAVLPASEGEALVNLALHAGPLAAGSLRALFSLGTGFREELGDDTGFANLSLYRRLDAAWLDHAGSEPTRQLLDAVARALSGLGLAAATLDAAAEPDARTDDQALRWQGHGFGRLSEREVAVDGAASLRVGMLALDLHALLSAVAEQHHDADGLAWPAPLAPFDLGILPGTADDRVSRERAEKLHRALERAGLSVLLDDRPGRPADLRRELRGWGLPAAVLFGPGLPADQVLLELRSGGPPAAVPEEALLAKLGRAPRAAASRATRANY